MKLRRLIRLWLGLHDETLTVPQSERGGVAHAKLREAPPMVDPLEKRRHLTASCSISALLLTIDDSADTTGHAITVTVNSSPATTSVSIAGSACGGSPFTNTLFNNISILAGTGADTISVSGASADQHLTSVAGSDGNDTITSVGANDSITGGNGNDSITSP